MLRGSMWQIAVRWGARLMGLVSTVVLARLLTPADYGLVAIAVLITGMVEIFNQTGQRLAIIRHPSPTREHYDSAWTIQVLISFGLGAIIWAATPLTTFYFHEPRAAAIVPIFAIRTVMAGFENIGTLNFRRDLQFRRQFQYNLYPSLISFVVTIASAFALRNYWALVIGIMTEQAATTLLSYVMEPYRPRFCVTKVREIWSFSIWTLVRFLGMYFSGQVDKIAIGGFGGAPSMGRYEVATDVATSPFRELNDPMITVLFPVMARIRHDKEKRRALYLSVLYWSALICTSISIGIALVAGDMVDLVLGSKWQDVKPLMPWLALGYGLLGLSSSVYSAFDTIGQPHVAARLQWLRLAGLCLCVFPVAFFLRDLRAIAITRFLVTLVVTPTLFFALSSALELHIRDFAVTLWRPLTAGLLMAAAVLAINREIAFTGTLRLLLDVGAGSLSFGASLMLLWFVSGQPEGPEGLLWTWLRTGRLHAKPAPTLVIGTSLPPPDDSR
jgi:O-antigen/teichoic acid export membrane protein